MYIKREFTQFSSISEIQNLLNYNPILYIFNLMQFAFV
jgi:hypothetical protein